ncbi:MAG: branched-chain amino acid ABC transporter permease [Acidimicrobiales bacterium]|nr:branched-chain amino acid ABC transporter permease [Acidimicrobiales bacterium]
MAFGRPLLRTSYAEDAAILPTWSQRGALGVAGFALALAALGVPFFEAIPAFLLGGTWLTPFNTMLVFAVAALGINILVGVTGQVSLGHSFFMGVGAYAAVLLGGDGRGGAACIPFHEQLGLLENTTRCGLGLPIWIWLPASGIAAALVGILVSPAAVRVRGLYLAIVTVGLVFIGRHLGNMLPEYAGDAESGRRWPPLEFRWWRRTDDSGDAFITFDEKGAWFSWIPGTDGITLSDDQKAFFFYLFVVIVATVLAKNLMRSRTGRALQAIRDRDVAAEVMGVPEREYKRLGFALSSAYAGVGGALLAVNLARVGPPEWSLFLAVDFIAILLIGGAGTIAGTLMGTFFVRLLPKMVERFTEKNADLAEGDGPVSTIASLLLTDGSRSDFGPIATSAQATGWPLPVALWNFVIFGVLIVVFLIAEPLGLFGIWLRIRNYWKGWPFSY